MTREEFIQKASYKHNNKYDYSKISYTNAREKVRIICPSHGDFFQTASEHLKGRGCPTCGKESMKQKLLNKPKEKRPSFELITKEIKDRNDIVKIRCPDCGRIFEKSYYNFTRSKSCPICKPNFHKKKSNEQFINEATEIFGNKYDYSLMNYSNNKTFIKIKCSSCQNVFKKLPKDFLKGKGCPTCNGGVGYSKDDFIRKAKEIHGEKSYDYSLVDYKNTWEKIKVKCNECGELLEVLPNSFLQGRGCAHGRKSFGEKIVADFLTEKGIDFKREKTFEGLVGTGGGLLRFDFYLPSQRIVIEYQGLQHYQSRERWGGKEYLKSLNENDQLKRNYCKKVGLKEIEISYLELRKIHEILLEEVA